MLDIFIIVVALWAIFSGWRNGFIREIVNSLGYFLGIIIAAACYSSFGEYLKVEGTQTNMITSIGAFFILWIIAPIALGLGANLLTRMINRVHLGGINRLGGAAVSLLKFTVLLSCLFNVMSLLGILNSERTQESTLYSPVKSVFSVLAKEIIDEAAAPASDPSNDSTKGDTTWIEVPKH